MDTRVLETLTATDVMTREVICLSADLDVRECERILLEEGISGAPVVDSEGHLQGVLSKTDLIGHHHAEGDAADLYEVRDSPAGRHVEFEPGRARDLMTPVPCMATEETSLADLAALMVRREVHRIIICRRRRVVGIVSSMDILRAIAALPDDDDDDATTFAE